MGLVDESWGEWPLDECGGLGTFRFWAVLSVEPGSAIEAAWLLREPGSSVPKEDSSKLPAADIPASGSSAASPRGRRKQREQAESHHLPGQLWS